MPKKHYVILNPGHDYAFYMAKFLNQYEYKGIGVFTDEGQYHLFENCVAHDPDLESAIEASFIVPNFPDLESLAKAILSDSWINEDIQGIIPWEEFTIETGAALGEHLGLDWNPLSVIHRFRNKYELKSYLRENSDIRINQSLIVNTVEEVEDFVDRVGKWPIVVKPTEGAGSRGVFFAQNIEEILEYCKDVFGTGQGDILLEEYIGGDEFVVNGITNAQGDVLITDVWIYDKRESHGIPNLYYQTIKVNRSEPFFEPLAYYAGEVIETLGLRKCPFHMELKYDEEGPCLIECGARFAGGNQPVFASLLHEHSLFELAACHYMEDIPFDIGDLHYDKYDQHQARILKGVQSYEIPSISGVFGVEEVQDLPSFYQFGFIKPIGSYLPVSKDLFTASYEVYLIHESPEQIEEDSNRVRDLLYYE